MRELPAGTVTLLFTDIEGSTHLLRQVGERYARVLQECRHLLRAAFHAHRGHEVDTQGDAFFVAFARATDAVSAAVAAQRALSTHAWPDGLAVRVRMGLHTGEPELSTEGYVGLDVHRAVRIMSAGHGGQVLLSQATRDLIEHVLPEEVSLRDLGEHRLKDLGHPTRLFQLVIEGLAADFPPLKTLDSHLNNLPIQPTAFIGREKEVAAVQQQLLRRDVRLLTLTGPGGVGKTRLGLQAAAELSEHFADGTWFVSLAPTSDPDLVIPAIAQTLDVREARGRSLLDQLKAALREKQVLLLLDNFEQVVSAATQVADLLGACPRLKVLVTSREALHVRAEHEFPVPTLALPDPKHLPDLAALSQYEAVALFIERAQAVKPDFQVTNANAPAVAEICTRLDGLPLAIELAAARSKLFPPQALLTRLEQRLPLLTRSVRDVPARQQTLRQTIQWSYDLLTAQEQRLFRRLSVFAGGCSWQAIEVLSTSFGDETAPVLDAVASLIDKNLLRQTAPEGEEPRLTLLETIREYGLEALSTSVEMATARQAHAAYYLALAEEAARWYNGPQIAEWLERLAREYDNLRTATEWSLDPAQVGPLLDMAIRLGEALTNFWWIRGRLREAQGFLEQVLARSKGVAPSARARILEKAAGFAFALGDLDRAEAELQESLTLYRELGDIRGMASSLENTAAIAQRKGANLAVIIPQLEECLALYRELGDQDTIAWSLLSLADHVSTQGDYRRGNVLFEESLAIFRELQSKLGIADCLKQSALWLFFGAQGDQATIHTRLEESLATYKELDHKVGIAFCCWVKGWVAFRQGDTDTARELLEQCLALFRETRDPWLTCWALAYLGRIKAHQGELTAALTLIEESLAMARALDNWPRAFCLERLAIVAAAQGKHTWVARLLGAAESLRESRGIPVTPAERADYEPAMAVAQASLGEQAFAAAWAEGRSMIFEQVLAAPGRSAMSPLI